MVLRASRLSLAALVLLAPMLASAQLGTTAPFTLGLSPESPQPYSRAVLTTLSTSINLANATLVVTQNGTKVYEGNVQPIAVTLGAPGALTALKAVVTSGDTSYTQTLSLRPQEVVLVAEPIASAPPLYAGKPLVPISGTVRITAVTNVRTSSGSKLSPTQLSYEWSVGGTRQGSLSGIGKSTIVVASPLEYRGRDVSVVVASQDGSLNGRASLSLSAEQPTLRIYENDPLLGIRFERALAGTHTLSKSEGSLYAAPYSFSLALGAPSLQWFLGGNSVQSGNVITLRPTGSGEGSAALSVTGSAGTYATTNATLNVLYGNQPSKGIFGL